MWKRTRTSLKGWVTCHCNDVRDSMTTGTLTKDSLQRSEYSINELIKKLEENEYKIDEVYYKHDITDDNLVDVPSREPEAKLTFDFIKEDNER